MAFSFKKIIAALFGFTLVILVHELGHFSFCKLFHIATPTFSIGFGPALLQKKIGATNFVLAAIPFGGYVEIAGMEQDEPPYSPHSFAAKPYYQKGLVILGGILFNLLFALFVFIMLRFTLKTTEAATAEKLTDADQNDEESLHLTSTQKERAELIKSYGRFIGPFGIFSLLGESTTQGFRFYWALLALLSLNLAVINMIPLPVFDGGQLLLYTLEALGLHITLAVKNMIFTLSWILIIALITLISTFDILRIFRKS
ncbi:MAG: site-2 protease family protein [Candidatus Babeliaceae bacterium]